METIIGTPEKRASQTFYTLSVAYDSEIYEFAVTITHNVLINTGKSFVSDVHLRQGKLKKAELQMLSEVVEKKMIEFLEL